MTQRICDLPGRCGIAGMTCIICRDREAAYLAAERECIQTEMILTNTTEATVYVDGFAIE